MFPDLLCLSTNSPILCIKKKEESTIPIPTAGKSPTKTVKKITKNRTIESLFFKLNNLFIPLKSIIPIPTEIRRAERTGFGTSLSNGPNPTKTIRRNKALKIPLKFVLPLELILATVPVVDPAPGSPPNNAATKLPIPWPINSRFPLCLVFVRLSATTEVSKVSIVPKPASVNPLTIAILNSENEIFKNSLKGRTIFGISLGISPIVE